MTGGAAAGGGGRQRSAGHLVLYAALAAASALYLLPFYVLVVTSMKSFADVSLAQMWALPPGLHFANFAQAWRGDAEWNVQMSGALLAALPTPLVYIVLGRYFMRGLMAGSLKG